MESYFVHRKSPAKKVTLKMRMIAAKTMLAAPTLVLPEAVYKVKKLEKATFALKTNRKARA